MTKLKITLLIIFVITTMSNLEAKKPEYILKVGKDGNKHLEDQHNILKKNSIEQIHKAGIRDGMTIWDIGCGNGMMTEIMASKVGETGKVYALDISAEQISTAQQLIKANKLDNVQFIVSDIESLKHTDYQAADIVYSRLLLMHVTDPIKVINSMRSLLKSGGIISLQESSMNSSKLNTTNNALRRYIDLMVDYGKTQGLDYNIGSRLLSIAQNLDYVTSIEHYTSSYNIATVADLFLRRLDEIRDSVINVGLIDEQEFDVLKSEVYKFFKNEDLEKLNIMIKQNHLLLKVK